MNTMKTLILTALMGATIATANAHVNLRSQGPAAPINMEETTVPIDQQTQVFMDGIALHQLNIDRAWEQYGRVVESIASKPGSVSALQSQMQTLIQYYQDDIDQGLRLEDSRKAIAEIEKMYSKKIAKQAKAENRQLARLQTLLSRELDREEREFHALKKAHAEQINEHTAPLIRSIERQLSNSSLRMEALDGQAGLASR